MRVDTDREGSWTLVQFLLQWEGKDRKILPYQNRNRERPPDAPNERNRMNATERRSAAFKSLAAEIKFLQSEVERLKAAFGPTIELEDLSALMLRESDHDKDCGCSWCQHVKKLKADAARLRAAVEDGK